VEVWNGHAKRYETIKIGGGLVAKDDMADCIAINNEMERQLIAKGKMKQGFDLDLQSYIDRELSRDEP
jgi:hypothetical protein